MSKLQHTLLLLLISLTLLTVSVSAQTSGTARRLAPTTFSNLGTPTAGDVRWCTNCQKTAPCTSGGTGASALADGATWSCAQASGSGGGSGDVVGPASATVGELVRFIDSTGKVVGRSNTFSGIAKLTNGIVSTLTPSGNGNTIATISGSIAAGSCLSVDLGGSGNLVDNGICVTTTSNQVLSGKTISGATNTFTNIPNSALTSSSITIGTTTIALGGSASVVAGLTLTQPTIADFTNAVHVHESTVSGGQLNASNVFGTGLIPVARGGTGNGVPSEDQLLIGNGTGYDLKTLPPCSNGVTDKLLYNSTTNTFSCGTDQSSGGGTGIVSINGLTPTSQTFSKTDDTNVTLTISSVTADHNFQLGWTGTLAAGRLNANVVQAVTNDTNVTGSISAQTLTLGWTGRLTMARQYINTVANDQANTYTAGAQDFGAASSLILPKAAGASPTASADLRYDTTSNTLEYGENGTNRTIVNTARSISTTSPLSGGGDLSANRTFSIADSAADGTTKGAASFTAADFNSTSGNISIDYTNGQVASSGQKGFLSSSDWSTFNNKVSPGSITGSGLTMATARILGRTTASAGAIEEISIGTGLSLSAGVLSSTTTGIGGSTGATDNAIIRADGTAGSTIQSSGATIDDSANISTTGTLTVGSSSAEAGIVALSQGTAQATVTSSIGLTAPTSVTAYNLVFPGTAGDGVLLWSNSSNIVTGTFTATTGTSSFVRSTTPTLVTYYQMAEATAPANPAADNLRIYVKDVAGVSKLCSIDSAGTETCGLGGGGGGSGTINTGATNAIPKYTAATTIDDSLASDDGTTFAYSGTGGISSTASGTGVLDLTEGGTAPGGVASHDILYADSTSHRLMTKLNNGSALTLVGIASAGTSGNFVKFASNGIDLIDGGAGSSGMADPGSNGVVVRTALNTTTARTITGTSNEISVSNGDGVSGNPTLSISSILDLSSKTLRIPNSTSLPGTCSVGDAYMDTDATSGQRFFLCESSNTWALQGDGGGGGGGANPAGSGSELQYRSTGTTFGAVTSSSVSGALVTLGDTLTVGGTGTGVLGLKDTDQTHYLNITVGSNLTADRAFTLTTGDAARTLTMTGDLTMSGAFNLTLTTTAATNVTLPTTGTLATLAGSESLTNKKLGSLTNNGFVKTSAGDGTLSVDTTTYSTASSSDTFTNKALDAEGTGNSVSRKFSFIIDGGGCSGTTATSGFDLPTSSAPTASCTGTTTTVGSTDYADGSTTGATRKFRLPSDWTGAVDVNLTWLANAASANAVRWQVSCGCIADSEASDTGPSYNATSASNTAYTGTANQRKTTSFTGIATTNCAAGETLWLKVERVGGDAGDTLTATARLLEVELVGRKNH